jgi:hypothetical protein
VSRDLTNLLFLKHVTKKGFVPMTLRNMITAAALSVLALSTGSMITAVEAKAQSLEPVYQHHKTYLINGLASIMPFVGYGFNNLKNKLDNAVHYSYATPVEGRIAIQPAVLADIKREYANDPNIQINLVGISYGGNIVTSLAAQLNSAGIPVNYLGVLDGPILAAVTPNVHRVDNFVCRYPGCMGQQVRLAKGNNITLHTEFKYASSHIGLGDYQKVHDRIIGQLTAYPMLIAGQPIDTMTTGSVQ